MTHLPNDDADCAHSRGEIFANQPCEIDARNQLIDDLESRLVRGINELYAIRNPIHARNPDDREAIRLSGKIDGLLVVKDWLRSYR